MLLIVNVLYLESLKYLVKYHIWNNCIITGDDLNGVCVGSCFSQEILVKLCALVYSAIGNVASKNLTLLEII